MMGYPGLGLAVDRLIDAPVAIVRRAWTQHTDKWRCPAPWSARVIALEREPGGNFATLMRSPAGKEVQTDGVMPEVVPGWRIATIDAYRRLRARRALYDGHLYLRPRGRLHPLSRRRAALDDRSAQPA